jgi:glutamyl-tRNA synthetase
MTLNKVRVRFAPSPTGELHLGGARTALFNYILAKKEKGSFVLRIEDTDRERSRENFALSQHENLLFLGLKPDESPFEGGNFGPYRQSQRTEIYQDYINRLLEEKKAYYCFCSSEKLAREKEEYIKKNHKGNYQYSRKCLNLNQEQIEIALKKTPPLIRFLVNREKKYEFKDLIRGEVNFLGKDIEDFVICRSNGDFSYHFSVVIDDHLMNITHVLRGEEHLSNTAKQLSIYEALS